MKRSLFTVGNTIISIRQHIIPNFSDLPSIINSSSALIPNTNIPISNTLLVYDAIHCWVASPIRQNGRTYGASDTKVALLPVTRVIRACSVQYGSQFTITMTSHSYPGAKLSPFFCHKFVFIGTFCDPLGIRFWVILVVSFYAVVYFYKIVENAVLRNMFFKRKFMMKTFKNVCIQKYRKQVSIVQSKE